MTCRKEAKYILSPCPMPWLGVLYIVWVMAYLVPMQNRSFFFLGIQKTVFMSEAISHGDGAETGAFDAAIP